MAACHLIPVLPDMKWSDCRHTLSAYPLAPSVARLLAHLFGMPVGKAVGTPCRHTLWHALSAYPVGIPLGQQRRHAPSQQIEGSGSMQHRSGLGATVRAVGLDRCPGSSLREACDMMSAYLFLACLQTFRVCWGHLRFLCERSLNVFSSSLACTGCTKLRSAEHPKHLRSYPPPPQATTKQTQTLRI